MILLLWVVEVSLLDIDFSFMVLPQNVWISNQCLKLKKTTIQKFKPLRNESN